MPAVIRMLVQNGECPIQLFRQNQARQLVRQGDGAKRKFEVGGRQCGVAPAVGRTNGEDQFLRTAVLIVADQLGDLPLPSCLPRLSSSTSTGGTRELLPKLFSNASSEANSLVSTAM